MLLGLTVLAAAAVARPARPAEAPGPLPWRVGGPLGFTVDAAAFPDSAGHDLEVYVRIPPASLASLVRVGEEPAKLRLSLRLRNSYGGKVQEKAEEFQIAPGDTGSSFGKVVILHVPVRSGSHQLQVRLQDLLSHKRGLLYFGRKVAESAEIQGDLVIPGAQGGRQISDLEFLWVNRPDAARAFSEGAGPTGGALPNPERLYGLYCSELRASFLARGSGEPRSWSWSARVLAKDGRVVTQRDSGVVIARTLAGTVAVDMATEPAGGYDLEIKAWQEGDATPVMRRAKFSLAWQPSFWNRNPRDIEDDVHLILDGEEEEAFAVLNPGEQEHYLDEFWKLRDPSPGTAENETRTTFHQRVEHANHTWGSTVIKGMFSDMGRTFIRYGDPDEVLKQVIPAGDYTLSQAITQLELTEDRPTGDVHAKGPGGDVRPFEVWIYERDTMFPLTTPPGVGLRPRKRLVFLFVDEQGHGDYTLRYTTE